jgi:hypothetical protein
MVPVMIRRGRLVRYSKAQRRPRVSKLRAKGLSGCHPSGQQPRQPDGGPEGQRKNYSHDNLLLLIIIIIFIPFPVVYRHKSLNSANKTYN